METIVSIPGMHCESCAALIKDISGDFTAISVAAVDLASKKVTLTHDDSFDLAAWTKEVESLGDTYRVVRS